MELSNPSIPSPKLEPCLHGLGSVIGLVRKPTGLSMLSFRHVYLRVRFWDLKADLGNDILERLGGSLFRVFAVSMVT